ncbi:MAG TPA: iron-sulfur cluster assembly scaffold protein [Acidobacteriota bacterium]|nr:iron-sulfur cluster assembly scaffold protein [Acidobacteriota bacterium]
MDEAVIKYYRWLLKTDFGNAGSFENASIFVEAVGEKMIHCGNTGNYMQLYLKVVNNWIDDIKYLCSCEPTANVAVEVLCDLMKGKSLDEAAGVSEQAFYQWIGCDGEELKLKVRGLLEMMNEGIARYKAQMLASKKVTDSPQW